MEERIYIALEDPRYGVLNITINDLERALSLDPDGPFKWAEYIPVAPMLGAIPTWQCVRNYGYSCRAFQPFTPRR